MTDAKKIPHYVGLLALFALGLYLRWPLPSPEWQHIDERVFILRSLGFWSGDLNPHFFNYPTLHFYLASALYYLHYLFSDAESLVSFVAYRYFVDGGDLIEIVRGLNSVLSALTGIVCALIGRRLYGAWAGWAAGGLFCLLPLSVRFAHLAIVDVPLALWSLCALYCAVRLIDEGRVRDALCGGLFAGLALATKYPGGLAFVPVALACGWRFGLMRWPLYGGGLVMGGVFVLCSPYVLLDWSSAWTSIAAMGSEHMVGDGHGGRDIALWHHLRYNLRYGVGLLGLLALAAGLLVQGRSHRRAEWLVVSALVSWLLLLGVSSSVFMRYALPLGGLVVLVWLRALSMVGGPVWVRWVLVFVLAVEPLYGTYRTRALLAGEDTRVLAHQWIEENAPPGTWLIELGNGSAALPVLTPKHVYGREHRFTDSYDRLALIAAYTSLASREDLPDFMVDIDANLAISIQGDGKSWALISDCDHPLCGEDTTVAATRLRQQANWQIEWITGEGEEAVFDLVDWLFIPIGGYGDIRYSGPNLQLGLAPAPSGWRGGDAQQFFSLLRDLSKLEESIEVGDWAEGKSIVEEMKLNPLLASVVMSKIYLFKYMNYAGLCYFKQGHFAEAIPFWEKATNILNKDLGIENRALMLNDLGVAYTREGRYEEALRVWNESAGLMPDWVDSHYNAAHVLIHNLQRYREGLQLLGKVLVLAPQRIEARFLAAVAHQQIGDWQQALGLYGQLLTQVADQTNVLFNMAAVRVEMGQKEQAIGLLQRAVQIRESARIFLQLGLLYGEMGETEKARANLKKVIELQPDHPQAAEIRRLQGVAD